MKMNWFRVYNDARNDAKLRTLSDAQFRVWFNLLCLSSEQAERGTVKDYDFDLLSIEVAGGDDDLLRSTIRQLIKLRIICDDGADLGFLHFLERQYDKPSDQPAAVKERVTRHRETLYKEGVTLSNAVKRDVTHIQEERRIEESIEDESGAEVASDHHPPPVSIKPYQQRKTLSAHPLPPEFCISDTMRSWAKTKHITNFIDIDKHTARFIAYWTEGEGQGKQKKNWLLTWQNWIEDEAAKAEARGARNGANGNGANHSSIGRVQIQQKKEGPGQESFVPGLADEVARLSSQTKRG